MAPRWSRGPALAAASLAACSIHPSDGEVGVYVAPPPLTLHAVIRDFKKWNPTDPTTVPDFDNGGSRIDPDVVTDTLGSDGKPVYKFPDTSSPSTHGKKSFDTWYHDTPGINYRVNYPLAFASIPGGGLSYNSDENGIFVARDVGLSRKMFLPI